MASAFLAASLIGTVAIVVLSPFPVWAQVAASAWVIGLALRADRELRRATGLRLDCARAIAVRNACGHWRVGSVRDGSFVAPWLAIVRWRPEGARLDRTLVILPDMLSAEEMRRIRVILRWA